MTRVGLPGEAHERRRPEGPPGSCTKAHQKVPRAISLPLGILPTDRFYASETPDTGFPLLPIDPSFEAVNNQEQAGNPFPTREPPVTQGNREGIPGRFLSAAAGIPTEPRSPRRVPGPVGSRSSRGRAK